MPITIKEIISSDSMSGVIEKVNFNFDQLILAGGGPPGIQGLQGIDGPIGPQGFRGDHWFVGASAFGQTADHDGVSSLRVQDHYVDENGDVYSYYNITGVTGWTASGVNLRGPQGPTGDAGGSLEWKIYLANLAGNPLGAGYSPTPSDGQTPLDIDFLIPNKTYKNSMFIGDPGWAFFNLKNFGANNFANSDSETVPKFTVIQNNVNQKGLNGFSFGGPLLDGGTGASAYGNSGMTSSGGPTYSAYNFVNASFVTEQESALEPDWITKWRIHSFRSNIKIKAGGNYGGNPSFGYRPATLELEANRVRIFDYGKDKYIELEPNVIFNFGTPGFSDIVREIQINSKPILNILPGSAGATNTYGYIALQNSLGSGSSSVDPGWPEHRYGTVLIGPTYNTTQQMPLATNSFQALGIIRKITRFDGNDAAIKFFQPDIQPDSRIEDAKWLSLAGSITPVRTTEDAINVNGITGVILDSLMINAGSYNIDGNTTSISGATAYNAGRLGLSNNTRTMNKPQFPIHISVIPDNATRKFMWDGDSVISDDRVSNWYVGFDADTGGSSDGGIAFGNTVWKDDRYTSVVAVGSGFSIPIPIPNSLTNTIIKSYTRGSVSPPWYGSEDNIGSPYTTWSKVIGKFNPHIYMQPGLEDEFGNIGIGFVPGSTAYNILGSTDINQISFAKSKLAVNGSITVGPTSSGYHKFNNNAPFGGLLIGGIVVQGETKTQGLDTMRWKGPRTSSVYQTNFSESIDDINARIQVGFSSPKSILAKQFLSKGSANPMYPDFALSDAKTGIGTMIGELNTGALYADRIPVPIGPTTVSDTLPPVIVAKWTAGGNPGADTNSNNRRPGVGGFTVTDAFAMAPAYYNLNTIPWYGVNFKIRGGDGITTPDAHQIIYHQIPSKNSTVIIDLNSPMALPYYAEPVFPSLIGGFALSTNKLRYLNGVSNTNPIFNITPKFNSQQFTIEDGYYDGQILRIMFMDVNPNNYSVLVPNAIPNIPGSFNGGTASANTTYYGPVGIKDNIIMAAEKYSGNISGSVQSWPLSSPGTQNTEPANNRPWPMPNNWRTGNDWVVPSTAGGAAAQIDAAIKNALNQYTAANTTYWTDTAIGSYSEVTVGENGSFENLNGSQGIGAFRITSWRSITLQWFSDYGTNLDDWSFGFGNGCWVEIARENLVPRKMKLYSGSGTGGTYDDIESQPLSGNLVYSDMNNAFPQVTRTFTYYNPSGEGNLQIYDGISLIRQITGSTSGIMPLYGSLRLLMTTPLLQGNNNAVTVKCKIINFNAKTGNVNTIVRDINLASTGGQVTLDTFTPGGVIPLPGANEVQSIEVSTIIKRNTI